MAIAACIHLMIKELPLYTPIDWLTLYVCLEGLFAIILVAILWNVGLAVSLVKFALFSAAFGGSSLEPLYSI